MNLSEMQRGEFLAGGAAISILRPGIGPKSILRIAAAPIGTGIDPYRLGASGIDELAWLYADGLIGWNGGPVPLLADLPESSGDGRILRYRLRRAIWHDARPVRASDVRSAWLELKQLGYHPYAAVRDVLPSSEREFVVHLDSPVHGFVRSFFGPYGTPAMPLLRQTDRGIPMGTGPFVPRSHADPGRWTLERWPASPRGAPKLAGLDLRILPDARTASFQLASGEADVAYPLRSARLYPSLRPFARRRRVTSIVFFIFNTEGVLNSPQLRRWFVASINLPQLQRRFDDELRGLFSSYTMPERPTAIGRLLSRAVPARERLHESLHGRSLQIVYPADNPVYEAVVNELQQNLGGEPFVQTRHFVAAVLLDRDGPLSRGLFDVAIIGLPYGDDPDLAPRWACASRAPRGANISRWCDSAFESALARHDSADALDRIVQELVCVPLGPAREDIGLNDRVYGFVAPAPFVPFTYSCTNWTVASR